MLIKSAIATILSGTIGGLTAIRCRSGISLRAKAKPVNPRTENQMVIRNLIRTLSSAWSELTEDQREAWSLFGSNVPVVGKFGDDLYLSGYQNFLRSNVPRMQAGLTRVEDGPTAMSQPSMKALQQAIPYDINSVDISYSTNQSWVHEDGAAMLFYISRPQGAGVESLRTSTKYAGKIAGSSVSPPGGFQFVLSPFELAVGQNIWLNTRVTRLDGRLSPVAVYGPLVVRSLFKK